MKWRNDLKNRREVDNDAIKKLLGQESSRRNESEKKSRNQKKRKRKVRNLNRSTDPQVSKTTSEDVRLSMMSDESDSDVDNDSLESKPVYESKKVAVYKKVRKVCSTPNPFMSSVYVQTFSAQWAFRYAPPTSPVMTCRPCFAAMVMMIRTLSVFTTEEYNGQSGEEIICPPATSRAFRVPSDLTSKTK